MAKYRKKPVVVEAIRWTGENDIELTLFMDKTFRRNPKNYCELQIPTREGLMTVKRGDYVIKEPFATDDRKFYPCKPDIFEQTYELVQ